LKVIAFTRPERRLKESIAIAEAAGFAVMAAPSLEILSRDVRDIDGLFRTMNEDDTVVFTSPTSVEECIRSPLFRGSLNGTRVVSIGPGTSEALRSVGVEADEMPSEYSSEGMVRHLSGSVSGKRVILIRADRGSRTLDRGLEAAGAVVVDFAAYDLIPADPVHLNSILDAGKDGKIDVFAFTSPLSAKAFVEAAEKRAGNMEMFRKAKVAAIGKPTKDMLGSLGIVADIVPENATFGDMISEIKRRVG
jgi:uroporphyrinogen-III synthase